EAGAKSDFVHRELLDPEELRRTPELLLPEEVAQRHPERLLGNAAQVRGGELEVVGEIRDARGAPPRVATIMEIVRDGPLQAVAGHAAGSWWWARHAVAGSR